MDLSFIPFVEQLLQIGPDELGELSSVVKVTIKYNLFFNH